MLYRRVDLLLAYEKEEANVESRREAYDMMKRHYPEVGGAGFDLQLAQCSSICSMYAFQNRFNAKFLCRLAEAVYLYGRSLFEIDEDKRKHLCFEGTVRMPWFVRFIIADLPF